MIEDEMEFAHIQPTGLQGWGRGRNARYYDIIQHPDCYAVLSWKTHRYLDKLYENMGDDDETTKR